MKHLYLTAAIIGLTFTASAAFIDTTDNKNYTVDEAIQLKNKTPIVLEGQIQKHVHKDKYLFSDGTNQMTVEIKNNRWNDVDVTPNDRVRLTGEIDRDSDGVKLEVKRIDLIR